MPGSAVMTGVAGELRVGYAVAARLVKFNLSQPDGVNWQIGATIADPNPVYFGQFEKYDIRLNVGNRIWRWRGVTPGLEGDRLMWSGDTEPEVL